MQVLIHHHRTDRDAVGCTKTAIFHIHRNSNLRIIHRSESHEHRMVFTAILCRTGFAACLYTRQDCADHTAGCTTRTTCNSGTHPLHNFIVIFPVDRRDTGGTVDTVQFIILYLLYNMRSNEMPPVGNGCTQIGYLQRGRIEVLPVR